MVASISEVRLVGLTLSLGPIYQISSSVERKGANGLSNVSIVND